MEEAKLTVSQRKVLVDLINPDHWDAQVWKMARDSHKEARSSLEESLIRQLADKKAVQMMENVEHWRSNLEAAEKLLAEFGIKLDHEQRPTLTGKSAFRKAVEKRLDDELGTSDDLSKKFALATIKVWTVPTAEQAYKIVEELQSFVK